MDIEVYGCASGLVNVVMWTKVRTPTSIEYGDRQIQAPQQTSMEAISFHRDAGQWDTTNWIVVYPGFEVQADEFDG